MEHTAVLTLALIFHLATSSLVFLGPNQGLLSLPTFQPSGCPLPRHPTAGSGLNGAVAEMVSGELTLCGGYNGQWDALAACYALVDEHWRERAPLPSPRQHAAASMDALGHMLVSGRENEFLNKVSSTLVLGLDGAWQSGPALEVGMDKHCQVSTRLGVLVIGGFNYDDRTLNSVFLLEPNASSWTSLSSMVSPREAFACSVLDDQVWVMGGFIDGTEGWSSGFLDTTEVIRSSIKTS